MAERAPEAAPPPVVVIVMGVSGAGKSTIGRMLAERLGWAFFDADDFHDAASIAKMHAAIPLTDADRVPWLDALRRRVVAPSLHAGRPAVLACSALKRAYLTRLGADDPRVRLVYLKGDKALLRARLAARSGHFVGAALLDSQLQALEEPERALVADIAKPPAILVEDIALALLA